MMNQRVEQLSRRVQDDPDFLAFALGDYARSESLSDAALAQRIGCNVQQLSRLRLCRRPRPEQTLFHADMVRIASAFGIDRDIVSEAVRRSDALVSLRDAVEDAGFLMAARDRKDNESPESDDQGDAP